MLWLMLSKVRRCVAYSCARVGQVGSAPLRLPHNPQFHLVVPCVLFGMEVFAEKAMVSSPPPLTLDGEPAPGWIKGAAGWYALDGERLQDGAASCEDGTPCGGFCSFVRFADLF